MVRHCNFVLKLQIFILEDWAIAFTVFYLAVTTEATSNGAAGQPVGGGTYSPAVKSIETRYLANAVAAGSWLSCITAVKC